jgi:hypothetical protein
MKTRSFLFIAICSPLALGQFSPSHAATKKRNLQERTQFKIKNYKFKAANIYDAINHTMALAIKQDPTLKNISIVFGPMTPRSKEKPQELDITGNETLWNIIRYWSELFNIFMKIKGDTLIFDEIRTQP